jgi:DNA-binding CsgD family transcriptional regulator
VLAVMHERSGRASIRGFRLLSPRETQLIIFAGEGLTDKEIARELEISPGTVVTLWSKLRAKLGISSRISAVAVMSAVVSRLSSGFIPFGQEAVSLDSLLGRFSGVRLLVNSRGVILSASTGAMSALSVKPGQSLTHKLGKGLEIQDPLGLGIDATRLPWFRAFRDACDVMGVDLTIICESTRQSFTVDCHVVDDPILSLVAVLDFKSTAHGPADPARSTKAAIQLPDRGVSQLAAR